MRASSKLFYLALTTLLTISSASPVPDDVILDQEDSLNNYSLTSTTNKYQLAPLDSSEFGNDTEIYDERQKGQENYRITINGVRFLVAPASSMLAALSLADFKKDSGQNKTVVNLDDFAKLKTYLPKFFKRLRANQKKHHTEEVIVVKEQENEGS